MGHHHHQACDPNTIAGPRARAATADLQDLAEEHESRDLVSALHAYPYSYYYYY
jgi:hypothetical protein